MPMNKWIPNRHNRWMAFMPVLLMVLIFSYPAQGQRRGSSFLPGATPGQPAVKIATSILDMRVIDGRITAKIVNCPLQKALQEMADRTGIIFEFRSHDNPAVSVHLDKAPLEEAIDRIASSHNIILDYSKEEGRIGMVHVFPRTGAIQQPSLVILGSGTVTKTNDDVENPEQAIRALAENARLEIKHKAIKILLDNKSEESVKALVNSLTDPEPEIRLSVIEGLVELKNHEALPEILKCLKDKDPKVRQSTITAVALMGNYKNVQDLKPLSADKDINIASAADVAIKTLSGRH
jgi:hypothetical protein